MKPWLALLWGCCLSQAIAFPLKAQIIPDGTTNTTVSPTIDGTSIEVGDRAGNNLFHSFEEFSVPNGSQAFFNNANDIVNIFSRVTGGNISNIDGLLGANGNANLFLINPAGIVFGEGASLDIGGSFFASTAESIVFSDDIQFSTANTEQPPLLTINQPLGLNLSSSSGDIAVNGSNLQVNNGETLAFFGGNVTITGGQIIAPGANIELGGLTEAGQISFEQLEATSFPEAVARGNVTLTDGTEVNVQAAGGGSIEVNAGNLELSGESDLLAGIAPESDSPQAQGGDITLNATGDITLTQLSGIRNRVEASAIGNGGAIEITANNLSVTEKSQIDANTAGQGNSGKIAINAADTVLIDGLRRRNDFNPDIPFEESDISGVGTIIAQVEKSGVGNSGGIDITTTDLLLNNGAVISSDIVGNGNAGAITIEAFDRVVFEGVNPEPPNTGNVISTGSFFGGTGNGSDIEITTTNLSFNDGSSIQNITSGQGDAGAITINASDTITLEGADRSERMFFSRIASLVDMAAIGNGGDIDLTTANLLLKDGAVITSSTVGQGDAGSITINASKTISLEGTNSLGEGSGIGSGVAPPAIGKGGDINITTSNLFLKDGAIIDASTAGRGDAGTITIKASDTISLEGTNSGGFGSLIVSEASAMIDENNVWQIAQGNAGTINITANNLFLKEGSAVATFTLAEGNAGEITIDVADTVLIEGEVSGFASGIFSNAEPIPQDLGAELPETMPVGDAGDIKITTARLFLKDGGEIETSSFIEGNAGTITVNASDLISIDGERGETQRSGIFSAVSSARGSTGTGNAGEIDITTTNLFLTRGGQINTNSFALGNAGKITIDVADTIVIDGETSNGNNNSGIFTRIGNSAEGNGGRIEITSTNLSLTNGGLVSANTSGLGDAGEIAIDVADTIAIDGESPNGDASGIFTRVSSSGRNANDINIKTNDLSLSNNGTVSVESLGQGEAGNLNVQANSLSLTNNAALFASTPVGTGGNVNLQIAEELILRNNSTISARALQDADGGNINIDAQFTIALDNQNNDILASAARGNGGDIDITTNSLFGFAQNSSIPNTNNIDASSEFGLDGTIAVNELDVNPAEALEELPTEIIDVTNLVAQNLCQQGRGSEFIVTGKGGMTVTPFQIRDAEIEEIDLVQPAIANENNTTRKGERLFAHFAQANTKPEIIEARGWIINERGNLELVARKTDTNSYPHVKSDRLCQNH